MSAVGLAIEVAGLYYIKIQKMPSPTQEWAPYKYDRILWNWHLRFLCVLLVVQTQCSDRLDIAEGKRGLQLCDLNLLVGNLVRSKNVSFNQECMSCLARIGDTLGEDCIAVR
jgi:hypothetical protein